MSDIYSKPYQFSTTTQHDFRNVHHCQVEHENSKAESFNCIITTSPDLTSMEMGWIYWPSPDGDFTANAKLTGQTPRSAQSLLGTMKEEIYMATVLGPWDWQRPRRVIRIQ